MRNGRGRWWVLSMCALGACASDQKEKREDAPGETVRSDAPQSTANVVVVPDPSPSTVVVHITILEDALREQLEANIPAEGSGETEVSYKRVPYRWKRGPIAVKFDRGRLVLLTSVTGTVVLLGERTFPIGLSVAGEPVIAADYQARLQSVEVAVRAQGPVDKINVIINEKLQEVLTEQLTTMRIDLRPMLLGAYQRLARPIPLPIPGENACANLRIVSIQAGPTVLAGGVEKDIGIVVMPSVTMPCEAVAEQAASLPPLANVASLGSGPFMVTIPVAAQYEEISRAMEKAMGGRLKLSADQPGLYLEKPSVYSSNEQLVIRVGLGGYVQSGPIRTKIDGELFLRGHPAVVDNQVVVPDLELTPGTSNALIKLKFAVDGKSIRDQAQQAIRFDLSERLHAARDKMSKELSFEDGKGCVQADVLRTEVTGIHPHRGFLRIYVQTWAQVTLSMPCKPASAMTAASLKAPVSTSSSGAPSSASR